MVVLGGSVVDVVGCLVVVVVDTGRLVVVDDEGEEDDSTVTAGVVEGGVVGGTVGDSPRLAVDTSTPRSLSWVTTPRATAGAQPNLH